MEVIDIALVNLYPHHGFEDKKKKKKKKLTVFMFVLFCILFDCFDWLLWQLEYSTVLV